MALLADPSKAGTCLVVLASGAWVEPQLARFKSGEAPAGGGLEAGRQEGWGLVLGAFVESQRYVLAGAGKSGGSWFVFPHKPAASQTAIHPWPPCSGQACQRPGFRRRPRPPRLGAWQPRQRPRYLPASQQHTGD